MEVAAIDETFLLLQVERQAQQDVREGTKEALRWVRSYQINQTAPRRSVPELSLPEALSESDGWLACRV